jgi:catechol 2,3-dioxygenase-like lactoylglutathione lyase family enzyme
MKPQPMIVVRDVPASSRYYQTLLGCESGHGGEEYERIVFEDELVMQIHRWDAHDHPHMGRPELPNGNGALLWFETTDFDAALARARRLRADIVDGPHINENAQHREVWIKDPDGYVVVIAGPYGDLTPR